MTERGRERGNTRENQTVKKADRVRDTDMRVCEKDRKRVGKGKEREDEKVTVRQTEKNMEKTKERGRERQSKGKYMRVRDRQTEGGVRRIKNERKTK